MVATSLNCGGKRDQVFVASLLSQVQLRKNSKISRLLPQLRTTVKWYV